MQDRNVIELEQEIKKLQEQLLVAKGSLKKVYAIGKKVNNVVAGHGDYYDEMQIRPMGIYGSEGFAPIFTSYQRATEYISNMKYSTGYVPIELVLIED